MRLRRGCLLAVPLSLAIVCSRALAVLELSFDYSSFDNPNNPNVTPHFGLAQFNVLNYPSPNGRYMMTSTDNNRPLMTANGNALAEFYNFLQARYNEQSPKNGAAAADAINAYTITHSTKNGPRPNWLILNEISSSLWQSSDPTYKTWLVDVVTRLKDHHNYNVVTLAPFATVGTGNAAWWQAVAAKSYIGVENYLSGAEVLSAGGTYAQRFNFARSQYQASITTYGAAGVPKEKLFLTEHFGNSTSGTGWGRGGVASSDWDAVIQIRQDAIYSLAFPGFLAYGWGSNPMLVSEAELIQHEHWYRTRLVLPTQQPQWLSDDAPNVNGTIIPLSWNEQLNWLGGVPDSAGAVVNFYRTNTAARSITLDGPRTIGTLSFDSAHAYTINPGTGGSLTLNNGGTPAHVTVAQGNHVVSVPLVVAGSANIAVHGGSLTLNSGWSTAAAGSTTKSGPGALTISGSQSHAAGHTFIASDGVTNFDSSADGNLSIAVTAATVNFNTSQNTGVLVLNAGGSARLAPGKRMLNTSNVTAGGGKVDLTDGALVARGGAIGSLDGTTYSGILGMVQAGRNGGNWNGAGIYTSQSAALGAAPLTTLATALASEALGITAAQTATWRGQSVNGDSVLVAYTYAGDANLSGAIDADDYFQIDVGYSSLPGSVSYFKGDFNYDGVINGDDYFIIDSNFVAQGPPMTAASVDGFTTVPEPAAISLVAMGLTTASICRRRMKAQNTR